MSKINIGRKVAGWVHDAERFNLIKLTLWDYQKLTPEKLFGSTHEQYPYVTSNQMQRFMGRYIQWSIKKWNNFIKNNKKQNHQ